MLKYFMPLLAAVLLVEAASAKGDSYIVGFTISGKGLDAPVEVGIILPESYDPMTELLNAPAGVDPATDYPYSVVIHYDFEEFGGERDWRGWYDGEGVLFFPDDMIVGPGTWAAGWYTANPILAESLHSELPRVSPPGTGDGGLR
jgi:hypothetical protein